MFNTLTYITGIVPLESLSLPVKCVLGVAVNNSKSTQWVSQPPFVRVPLPENCLLNIENDDFISLEGITDVDEQIFRH
mgnify:FL=1